MDECRNWSRKLFTINASINPTNFDQTRFKMLGGISGEAYWAKMGDRPQDKRAGRAMDYANAKSADPVSACITALNRSKISYMPKCVVRSQETKALTVKEGFGACMNAKVLCQTR